MLHLIVCTLAMISTLCLLICIPFVYYKILDIKLLFIFIASKVKAKAFILKAFSIITYLLAFVTLK